MSQHKRLVVRTVIGLEVPDVQHHGSEIILSLSPEHLTMFRERAKEAGKEDLADYFAADVQSAPVPFEIVEEKEQMPEAFSEQFLMSSVAALYPAKSRARELARIQKAGATAGVPFAAMLKTAVNRIVGEIEATGSLDLTGYLPPVLFPKLHARIAEIDRMLEFRLEDGFAQWIMEQAMKDLINGQDDLLFDAYAFERPKKAHRDYVALIGRWRKEDGLPPITLEPWRAKRVQKTEGRAAA